MIEFIKKPWFKNLLFYLIAGPVVFYIVLSKKYRGGPCNPGMDLISILLLFLTSLILLIINLFKVIKNGKQYLPSLFLHLSALIIIVLSAFL